MAEEQQVAVETGKKPKKSTKKATPTKKTAKKSAAKNGKASSGARPPRTGVGEYIRAQLKLKNPPSNGDIAEAARKKFPGARTSPASVAWYRNR